MWFRTRQSSQQLKQLINFYLILNKYLISIKQQHMDAKKSAGTISGKWRRDENWIYDIQSKISFKYADLVLVSLTNWIFFSPPEKKTKKKKLNFQSEMWLDKLWNLFSHKNRFLNIFLALTNINERKKDSQYEYQMWSEKFPCFSFADDFSQRSTEPCSIRKHLWTIFMYDFSKIFFLDLFAWLSWSHCNWIWREMNPKNPFRMDTRRKFCGKLRLETEWWIMKKDETQKKPHRCQFSQAHIFRLRFSCAFFLVCSNL